MICALEDWKRRLQCGVCHRSLADEPVLWFVVLPYQAWWNAPRASINFRDLHPRPLRVLCPDCYGMPKMSGDHAVAFLCSSHVRMRFNSLLEAINDVPRFQPMPRSILCRLREGFIHYDPSHTTIIYEKVKRLPRTMPNGQILPPEERVES